MKEEVVEYKDYQINLRKRDSLTDAWYLTIYKDGKYCMGIKGVLPYDECMTTAKKYVDTQIILSKKDKKVLFESFKNYINEDEIIRKKEIIGKIEFDGDDEVFGGEWGDMKDHAEQIAVDLNLFDGDIEFYRNAFRVEGTTFNGDKILISQSGEFDMYGGPYTPKMKKPVIKVGGKDITSSVLKHLEKTTGIKGEQDVSQTDLWGYKFIKR